MNKGCSQLNIRRRIEETGQVSQIEKLCLDGICIKHFTTITKRLIEGCINLEYLTMNNCGLESLSLFPHLKKLMCLELSDNKLNGQDLSKIKLCSQLSFLTLDGNSIETQILFSPLEELKELEILIIRKNPFSEIQNYRQNLFKMLPSVQIIDCYDRGDNFVDTSDDEGEYITERGMSFRNFEEDGVEIDMQIINADKLMTQIQQNGQKQIKKQHPQITHPMRAFDDWRRSRRFEYDYSDSQSENEMINQFRRKIHKHE